MTPHASLVTKAINARNHGAKAIVVVNGTPAGTGRGRLRRHRKADDPDPLMRFGSVSGPIDARILFVQARNRIAQGWLAAAGKSLADVQKQIDDTMRRHRSSCRRRCAYPCARASSTTRATVNNVLAYLPGQVR